MNAENNIQSPQQQDNYALQLLLHLDSLSLVI